MNGQQQTVISEHQLEVVLVAGVVGMAFVCLVVVLWAMFRAVYVTRQMSRVRSGRR